MKPYRLLFLVMIALLVVRGLEIAAQDRRWVSYGPEVVEIEGRLIEQLKYGPPNFGESPKTDSKLRIPLLVLSPPVSVHADQRDPINSELKGIRLIQLLFYEIPHRRFMGKKVIVKGTLFHANTGGHYTDVVMSVQSISPVRSKRVSK